MKIPDHKRPDHITQAHTEELVDHYWGSVSYVTSLIKASELKAGLILSFYGIIFNFIYQNVDRVVNDFSSDILLYVLLGSWFICTIFSVYFSVRCFMPRIEGNYDKNVFFFNDVITKFGDIKQFSKTFYEVSLDEETLFDQLGQQIYIMSKIAAMKFKNVNRSLKFLAIGLFLFLVTVVYVILLELN